MEIKQIALDKLKRDKKQPRQTFDQEKIKGMAQSIITEGIINPVEIDKDFVIITGELRTRAAKLAGLKTVPCKIISVNPQERFRRQVVENLHNSTMTDWDTAQAIKKLLDTAQGSIRSSKEKKGGLPDKGIHELSRIIGKSEKFIIEKLYLLEASKPFQEAVRKGMPTSFIRAVKRAPEFYQKALEEKIVKGHFKTRDDAIEVATALTRNPEKGEQILNTKNIEELHKISPTHTQKLAIKLHTPDRLDELTKEFLEWLKANPLPTLLSISKSRVLLSLGTINLKIQEYLNQPKQLK